jgi:hypothetical protein
MKIRTREELHSQQNNVVHNKTSAAATATAIPQAMIGETAQLQHFHVVSVLEGARAHIQSVTPPGNVEVHDQTVLSQGLREATGLHQRWQHQIRHRVILNT